MDDDRTTTTTHLINLADIPFPLDMDISLYPGFNQTELWELGYASSWTYFCGASRFNTYLKIIPIIFIIII